MRATRSRSRKLWEAQSLDTSLCFPPTKEPSSLDITEIISTPPKRGRGRPPKTPQPVKEEETKKLVLGTGTAGNGMMTEAELQKWEEQHKKGINKKKRERRFQEAEVKLKEQAAASVKMEAPRRSPARAPVVESVASNEKSPNQIYIFQKSSPVKPKSPIPMNPFK